MARLSHRVKATKTPKFMVRKHNRCPLCGRSRAFIRAFNMCRCCFRKLANDGQLPGVRKASW